MFGTGILKGLGVTLKEFVGTYVDDVKKIPSRYAGGRDEIDQSNASAQTGLFTVQYPEERRKLSERFRYIPMLIYDADTGEDLCTACGICAKVCPPQCIWIVRAKDEKGKPMTKPADFWIDTTICMNCGLCAEFCPFDAIKMNHDYEIAAYHRMPSLVFDLQELRVPTTYYARLRPTDWAAEEAARRAEAEAKAARAAARPAAARALLPREKALLRPPRLHRQRAHRSHRKRSSGAKRRWPRSAPLLRRQHSPPPAPAGDGQEEK